MEVDFGHGRRPEGTNNGSRQIRKPNYSTLAQFLSQIPGLYSKDTIGPGSQIGSVRKVGGYRVICQFLGLGIKLQRPAPRMFPEIER